MRRAKPPHKTVLKPNTARQLEYLMDRGLCTPFGENLVVAARNRPVKQFDGTIKIEKFDDGSPIHGV